MPLMTTPISPEAVTRILGAAGVRLVRLETADLHGISRSKVVPLSLLPKIVRDGTAVYGGLLHSDARGDDVPANHFSGGRPFLPDYLLRPDLSTLAVLDPAQAPASARVVCDLHLPDGAPVPAAPRSVVKRLLAEFAALGATPKLGFEYEFFLARDTADRSPVFADRQLAATLRNLFDQAFTEGLFAALAALGITPLGFFAENAPGQLETPFDAAVGLEAPDQAFAFKGAVKEVAARLGYHASFMTKRFADEAGSGGHVHQSLLDAATGENLFAPSPGTDHPVSESGRRVLAGQLAHASALTALLSPTVNCYKRYRPHIFAPTNACWGLDNRQAAIRVPLATGAATRLETRVGGAAADPYVVAAGLLAAGLDGLRREMVPPPPAVGDITTDPAHPPLPRSLDAALDALNADAALRAILGDPFVDLFLLVKRSELRRCRAAVPDYDAPTFQQRIDPWEIAEYGDLI